MRVGGLGGLMRRVRVPGCAVEGCSACAMQGRLGVAWIFFWQDREGGVFCRCGRERGESGDGARKKRKSVWLCLGRGWVDK